MAFMIKLMITSLQLNSICLNRRQALCETRLHRGAVLPHFKWGQRNDLKDRFVDVQVILRWGTFLMRERMRSMTSVGRLPSTFVNDLPSAAERLEPRPSAN